MKKVIKVEIKGKKGAQYFELSQAQQAEDFAVVSTAFVGGSYCITKVFVDEAKFEAYQSQKAGA